MKFAVSYFPTETAVGPAEMAVEAERLGFDALFVSEHSHIPVDTQFPLPGGVPQVFKSMFDPFVSLAASAAVTSRIKLGTGILLMPQHDPINCAKAVSTLDQISNGRVVVGIGTGWNQPEMENHGTVFEDRFRITLERIEAMKALWTQDEAGYAGRLVNITPSWQWPKPVQQPHPPILLAGAGPSILTRAVALGTGWYPQVAAEWDESLRHIQIPLDDLPAMAAELRQRAEDAGQPEPPITVTGLAPKPEFIEVLEASGVERLMLPLPREDGHIEALERYAETVKEFG